MGDAYTKEPEKYGDERPIVLQFSVQKRKRVPLFGNHPSEDPRDDASHLLNVSGGSFEGKFLRGPCVVALKYHYCPYL